MSVEPQPDQLRPGNHPMLPASEQRDPRSPRNWWGIVSFSALIPHHLARVAFGVLPVSALCEQTATLIGVRGP